MGVKTAFSFCFRGEKDHEVGVVHQKAMRMLRPAGHLSAFILFLCLLCFQDDLQAALHVVLMISRLEPAGRAGQG